MIYIFFCEVRQETNINLTMVAEPKESFVFFFFNDRGKAESFYR